MFPPRLAARRNPANTGVPDSTIVDPKPLEQAHQDTQARAKIGRAAGHPSHHAQASLS